VFINYSKSKEGTIQEGKTINLGPKTGPVSGQWSTLVNTVAHVRMHL
jgi:hypothetical protein